MLLSPRRRTDVEILADATNTFVPMDQTPSPLPDPGFGVIDDVEGVVNPDLWLHVIEELDTGTDLGRLVLCPAHEGSNRRFGAVGPNQDAYYLGLAPGQEHWLLSGPGPFPDDESQEGSATVSFSIRAAEYQTSLDVQQFDSPRHRFEIGYFEADNLALPPGMPVWRIQTSPGPAAGYLAFEPSLGEQRWWARPELLIQGLLPPGPDGLWRFHAVRDPEDPPTPETLDEMWSLRLLPLA